MADLENQNQSETPVSDHKNIKKSKKPINLARRKKLKYGSVATAITCTVIAVVVLLNILVSVLVEKYPLKLDLTEEGKFEISEQSIEYLKNLEKDVNFTVLMAESNFQSSNSAMKMVSEILEKYTQYSDKVHLSYVDPTSNPDVVNTYQENYAASLTEGDIIVSDSSDNTKLRVVNIGNLFTYDQQKYYYYYYYGSGSLEDCITGFQGEQDLTSALMYVTDANPISVGILTTANGEALFNTSYHTNSLSAMAQSLFKNGYDIEYLDLYTGEADFENYDMLILPAPVNDLTTNAIDNLSAFLYHDGEYNKNLIYIADYTQGDTPHLDEFLETWGIQVTKNIAMESDSNTAQQVTLSNSRGSIPVPVVTIADEASGANLANASLPIVAPFCRTINLLWNSKSSGVTSALLQTSDSVYLNAMNEESQNTDTNPAGTQNIMAVSKRSTIIDNTSHASNLLVMGSVFLFDVNLMQDNSYNNAEYFISAVNMISGKDNNLVIASKDLTSETITITTAGVRGIYIVTFIIPSAVIAIGVWVFLRRKNK
ncbi:MAG: GldG family protein [Ruminococcus sp.]|nr:GldG family protein [Ruminococcus sp.]